MNSFLFSTYRQKPALVANSIRRISGRLIVLLLATAVNMQVTAQKQKSPLKLAEQYFAAGEYYTAAHLYGQFLNPSKKQKTVSGFPLNAKGRRMGGGDAGVSRTAVLYRQAESYRLANYWQEAAAAYKECLTKDPDQYADALYWYAVSERSLGHYAIAKESLTQYLALAGTAPRYKDAAEKELQTLNFIQQQLARPDSVLVKLRKLEIQGSNEKGAFAPVRMSGDKILISSTQTDSLRLPGINPNHSRLFSATLINGRVDGVAEFAIPGTDQRGNQGAAGISADGKTLYISNWKYENGRTVSSIYYSRKQEGGWSQPVLLPLINIDGHNSKQPFCSADGKYLYFASDRPGGSGNFDIWYALLKDDGTTTEPVNAGASVNTDADEQAPFYHNSSNTLVFSSNGRQGMGGFDLFAAKGSEANWAPAENLGHPVNSARDDLYFSAPENTALLSNAIFSSDRGTGCCLETYHIVKSPKGKQLFGTVRDCKENTALAGAEVNMKDPSGKTWSMLTDSEGKYMFDLSNIPSTDLVLTVSKDAFIRTVAPLKPASTDESDLLVDKITNTDLCIQAEEKLVIKPEDVVTVFFDFDKSELKPAALSKLDSISIILQENPVATIQISGYTDGRGTEEYNKKLSDRRARACAEYLLQKGIEAGRISFVSFGACCPIEMELINGRDNPDGRSRNRRALINVKKD